MKVMLLFPPQWAPYYPYLSLPSLSAYLRENGITVSQRDLNIEAYEAFLSKPNLLELQKRLNDSFTSLDSKPKLSGGIEQKYYSDLFLAKNAIAKIAYEIEGAKEILRDENYCYDPNKLHEARDTINQALGAISAAYFPTQMRLTDLEMPSFSGSYEDIVKITKDNESNPFFGFYKERFLPTIKDQSPDVIGISIAAGENQLVPSLTLSRLIKELLPKSHVVVGGHVVTMLADVIKNHSELFRRFFDSAILYDGEKPLFELVKCIEKGKSLDEVPNLLHYNGKKVISNPISQPEPINSLPTPNFDGLPIESYLSPEPVLPLLSSRGCYWNKCGFCTHSLGYRKHHMVRDATMVADDLQSLSIRHGARHFSFSDECISPSSIDKISGEIDKKDLKLRLSANIRLEKQFDRSLCAKIANAGFKLLYLGLESGNDRVLGLINKGTSTEIAKETCRNVHDSGIWNHVYIMIGFPSETEDEAHDTAEFLNSNKDIIRSFEIDSFQLSRGSPVAQNPEEFGVTILSDPENQFLLTLNYTNSAGLSNAEAAQLKNEFIKSLSIEYGNDTIINTVDNYLPLYLSYYESTDPFLISVKRNPLLARGKSHKHINRRSCPKKYESVIVDSINFDLSSIRESIANESGINAFPSATCVLLDLNKHAIYSAQPSAKLILDQCDGSKSVAEITRKLAKPFGLSEVEMEKSCSEFLEAMHDMNFISI